MARMGMDVDQVDAAGGNLKKKAAAIRTLSGDIGKIVNGLPAIWDGADAKQFVTEWWPQHKKSLESIASSIEGLGQSAQNNAAEQRGVSKRY